MERESAETRTQLLKAPGRAALPAAEVQVLVRAQHDERVVKLRSAGSGGAPQRVSRRRAAQERPVGGLAALSGSVQHVRCGAAGRRRWQVR